MSLLGHDFTVDTEESVPLETQIFSITKALLNASDTNNDKKSP